MSLVSAKGRSAIKSVEIKHKTCKMENYAEKGQKS